MVLNLAGCRLRACRSLSGQFLRLAMLPLTERMKSESAGSSLTRFCQ